MTTPAMVWLAIGAFFAALYFVIAVVVSIAGFKDLRRLLRGAEQGQKGRAGPGSFGHS